LAISETDFGDKNLTWAILSFKIEKNGLETSLVGIA
jgi:hypothetical protein